MGHSRRRLRALLLGGLVVLALALPARATATLEVLYRAADVVYVNAGKVDGLRVGDGLTAAAAWLEVTHLAGETAACRVVGESWPVRAGDRITRVLARPASWVSRGPLPVAALQVGDPEWSYPLVPVMSYYPLRPVELEGSITVDWEVFRGDAGKSADFERRTARLNLRARGLGSEAHELRLRMSGYEYSSSSRNRIYEAAFVRRPREGAAGFSLGRLTGGPRIGYGALDGLLGQVELGPAFSLGGFYGSPAELDVWGFDSAARRYGLFAEYLAELGQAGPAFDLRMAAIHEDLGGETSRDYLNFEGRTASRAGRWSLHHRAEIDLNRGWRRELAGNSVQLSNLSLSLARRFEGGRRLSLSYDRFELYRTGDTRWLPGELFGHRPRHAVRANLSLGRARGWRMSLGAGARAREGDPERSYSFSAGARSATITPWRIVLGADLLAFSNPLTDGYTAHLRVSRPFSNRRRLYVDLGRRQWWLRPGDLSQSGQWLRLGGDFELRPNLSLRGEYEITSGDALAGHRSVVGLRYRIRNRR